jgi:hypothetical protein
MVFRVSVGSRLQLDGKDVEESTLLSSLTKARPLRPSPYVILSKTSQVDCDRWTRLTSDIDAHFGCRTNYCFY